MIKKRTVIILTYKERILLVKRKKGNLSYYCFPGGTIEKGENAIDAVKREAKEELSYNISGTLSHIIQLNKKDINEKSFYFYRELNSTFRPKLNTNSPEFKKISNKYVFTPVWVDYTKIEKMNIFPIEIKDLLLKIHPREIKNTIYLPSIKANEK